MPFQFVAGDTVTGINTQDSPGTPLDITGSDQYFVTFAIDKSNLDVDFQLHFDLYNTEIKNGNYIVGGFAPFSHDAGTIPPGTPPPPPPPPPQNDVPEPVSVLVWTLLAASVSVAYRRRKR